MVRWWRHTHHRSPPSCSPGARRHHLGRLPPSIPSPSTPNLDSSHPLVLFSRKLHASKTNSSIGRSGLDIIEFFTNSCGEYVLVRPLPHACPHTHPPVSIGSRLSRTSGHDTDRNLMVSKYFLNLHNLSAFSAWQGNLLDNSKFPSC